MFCRHSKPVKGTKINWMKAGIDQCDKLFTVSPNYALELHSNAARGVELNGDIRKKGAIKGIANGMDEQEWNPSTDKYIDIKYDASTVSRFLINLVVHHVFTNHGDHTCCSSGATSKASLERNAASRTWVASGS